MPFAPQKTLLKRSELFVTHAGLNSVLEGLPTATPILALPFNGDQVQGASACDFKHQCHYGPSVAANRHLHVKRSKLSSICFRIAYEIAFVTDPCDARAYLRSAHFKAYIYSLLYTSKLLLL